MTRWSSWYVKDISRYSPERSDLSFILVNLTKIFQRPIKTIWEIIQACPTFKAIYGYGACMLLFSLSLLYLNHIQYSEYLFFVAMAFAPISSLTMDGFEQVFVHGVSSVHQPCYLYICWSTYSWSAYTCSIWLWFYLWRNHS